MVQCVYWYSVTIFSMKISGVTKVGITWCCNWLCHSFYLKSDDFYLSSCYRPLSPLAPLHLSRWLFVQCSCKFFRKKIFTSRLSLGCYPPPGMHPHPSPNDATDENWVMTNEIANIKECIFFSLCRWRLVSFFCLFVLCSDGSAMGSSVKDDVYDFLFKG